MRGALIGFPERMRLDVDHPRGCGEHSFGNSFIISFWGSSPRMRGALWDSDFSNYEKRIIPADAGSTRFAIAFCCKK